MPSVAVSWSPSPFGENFEGMASAAATIGAVLSTVTDCCELVPALPEMSSMEKMALYVSSGTSTPESYLPSHWTVAGGRRR